jgi:hypothetical protein
VIFPPSPYVWKGQTVQYNISIDCYPEQAPSWLLDMILGPRPKSKSNGKANGFAAGEVVRGTCGPKVSSEINPLPSKSQLAGALL